MNVIAAATTPSQCASVSVPKEVDVSTISFTPQNVRKTYAGAGGTRRSLYG